MFRYITAIKEKIQGKPLSLRSPKWTAVRKHYILENNSCAACGCTTNLQVHHKEPFHLHPEKELDPSNFITLCEDKDDKCHLIIGHLGDWKSFNPNVVEDAAKNLAKV